MTDTRSFDRNVLRAELMEILRDVLPQDTGGFYSGGVSETRQLRLADRLVEFVEAKVKEPAR